MKRWVLIVLLLYSGQLASAQSSAPPFLYSAFVRGGAIVIGSIVDVQHTPSGMGNLTVSIDEQLRGPAVPKQIEIRFTLHGVSPKRGPFIWDRVHPEVGKTILLILDPRTPWSAAAVVDATSSDAPWVQAVKRMILLENSDKAAALDSISDSVPVISKLAVDLLLNKLCISDDPCRATVLQRLEAVALDKSRKETDRMQAVSIIGFKIYTPFAPESEISQRAISVLFRLLADPDGQVRSEAVQILYGYFFGGGTIHPLIPKLDAQARSSIVSQLQSDVEGHQSLTLQEERLLELIGAK